MLETFPVRDGTRGARPCHDATAFAISVPLVTSPHRYVTTSISRRNQQHWHTLRRPLLMARRALKESPPIKRQMLVSVSELSRSSSPQSRSLVEGTWFKMICGASSHDVARIRNLSMLYATLGVDCVDAAADTAVMAAVREGFAAATALSEDRRDAGLQTPWLMVSVNDNEDPHFRKATFPTSACPSACARPCEFVCPADAIDATGVLADICYGCGRCIPVCPESIISAVSYVHSADYVCQLLCAADAVEIHTSSGNDADFRRLWEAIGETAIANLKLVAVSFPDPGTDQQLGACVADRRAANEW
jgi:Fe-S-cluster-containing hydrogenase component 2